MVRVARRWLWMALAAYLVALHGVVVVLMVKTDFAVRAGKTLGWLPPEEWTERIYRDILLQAAQDPDVAAGSVVLVGDSIIRGVPARAVAANAANFGIGGDTTHTLRARLPLLRSLSAAEAIVVGVGVNDLKYRDGAAIAADYAVLLDGLPRNVPVIVVSVLPVDASAVQVIARSYLRNPILRGLNTGLAEMCRQRARCRFLDVWPEMIDAASGGLEPSLGGGDGWHLSAAGNRVLGRLIRDAVISARSTRP